MGRWRRVCGGSGCSGSGLTAEPVAQADEEDHQRRDRQRGQEQSEPGQGPLAENRPEFDDHVDGAPEVGDLVFEDSSGEGKDAMRDLQYSIRRRQERGENGKGGCDHGEAEIDEERQAASRRISSRAKRDRSGIQDKPLAAPQPETFAEQICEAASHKQQGMKRGKQLAHAARVYHANAMDSHGRSVVQRHLLEEKGADEEHGADHVSTVFEAVDCP